MVLPPPYSKGLNGSSESSEEDEGEGEAPKDAGTVHVNIVWGMKDVRVWDEKAIARHDGQM